MEFVAGDAEAEVAASAAWLDEIEPDWAERIDLALLNLSDNHLCVLGQVFAKQANALDGSGFMYGLRTSVQSGIPSATMNGFLGSDHLSAWKALIEERTQ